MNSPKDNWKVLGEKNGVATLVFSHPTDLTIWHVKEITVTGSDEDRAEVFGQHYAAFLERCKVEMFRPNITDGNPALETTWINTVKEVPGDGDEIGYLVNGTEYIPETTPSGIKTDSILVWLMGLTTEYYQQCSDHAVWKEAVSQYTRSREYDSAVKKNAARKEEPPLPKLVGYVKVSDKPKKVEAPVPAPNKLSGKLTKKEKTAIKGLINEQQQPGLMSVASPPEIRPDPIATVRVNRDPKKITT